MKGEAIMAKSTQAKDLDYLNYAVGVVVSQFPDIMNRDVWDKEVARKEAEEKATAEEAEKAKEAVDPEAPANDEHPSE